MSVFDTQTRIDYLLLVYYRISLLWRRQDTPELSKLDEAKTSLNLASMTLFRNIIGQFPLVQTVYDSDLEVTTCA